MAYEKLNLANGQKFNAAHLAHIENGIEEAFNNATPTPGEPGKDGISATHSWNGTVLTITSASGTSSADLKGSKGDKGDAPVKYVDYWTDAEQETIVNRVISALGTPVFGRVDENNNIILSGELTTGTYTVKYESSDGSLTVVGEIKTEIEPEYTNVLAQAVGYDGTVLDGVGYKNGYRLTGSQTSADNMSYLVANASYFATGFIPYTLSDAENCVPIYVKGADLSAANLGDYSRISMYSSNKAAEYAETCALSDSAANGVTITSLGELYYQITPNFNFFYTGEWHSNDAKYIRLSMPGSGDGVIMTINELIE